MKLNDVCMYTCTCTCTHFCVGMYSCLFNIVLIIDYIMYTAVLLLYTNVLLMPINKERVSESLSWTPDQKWRVCFCSCTVHVDLLRHSLDWFKVCLGSSLFLVEGCFSSPLCCLIGLRLLRSLVKEKIQCSYVLINAVSYIMKEVTLSPVPLIIPPSTSSVPSLKHHWLLPYCIINHSFLPLFHHQHINTV